MSSEEIATSHFYYAIYCGALAVVVPWLVVRFSRSAAAVAAGVLALAGSIMESISNNHMPSKYDIRVDILIIVPLLILAWLTCLGFTVFATWKALGKPLPDGDQA